MIELKIDPEFQNKIPPMPKEAFDGLESDILADGYVRDKLIVWKEENTLVDGHNRWKIIQAHKDVLDGKFEIEYKSFPDRYAVIAWICANQLHKHNMNEMQQAYLLKEEYEARQKSIKRDENGRFSPSGEINHTVSTSLIDGSSIPFSYQTGKENKTRSVIAQEHNISESDVRTAVEVGRGIDRAEMVEPGFKNQVLSGEVKVTKQQLKNLRRISDDEEAKAAVESIKNPKEEKPKNRRGNNGNGGKSGQNPRQIWEVAKKRDTNIENAIARITNPDSVKEFSFDDFVVEMESNAESLVSTLKALLVSHSTLLTTAEEREIISAIIEKEIIKKIVKIKELVIHNEEI